MAEKIIKSTDLIQDDVFENLRTSAAKSVEEIQKLESALNLVKTAAAGVKKSGGGGGGTPNSSKELSDLNAKQLAANQLAEKRIKIDRELLVKKAELQKNRQSTKLMSAQAPPKIAENNVYSSPNS